MAARLHVVHPADRPVTPLLVADEAYHSKENQSANGRFYSQSARGPGCFFTPGICTGRLPFRCGAATGNDGAYFRNPNRPGASGTIQGHSARRSGSLHRTGAGGHCHLSDVPESRCGTGQNSGNICQQKGLRATFKNTPFSKVQNDYASHGKIVEVGGYGSDGCSNHAPDIPKIKRSVKIRPWVYAGACSVMAGLIRLARKPWYSVVSTASARVMRAARASGTMGGGIR